jgi:hypothetical protein
VPFLVLYESNSKTRGSLSPASEFSVENEW